MNSINYDALNLIKYALSGGAALPTQDCAAIEDINAHAMLPLLGPLCADLPPQARSRIEQASNRNARLFIEHSCAVAELNTLFARPVIFKGFAAAQYYPTASMRTLGDIDFMALGTDYDAADAAMKSHGYTCVDDEYKLELYPRHTSYDKCGVHYELHRYFTHRLSDKNLALDSMIENAEPELRTTDGCAFYSLPDDVNGLVLLEHIEHHLHSGLGLRQIVDWLCYVRAYMTDERWYGGFGEAAALTGLRKIAIYTTALAEKYLGGPHRRFADEADPAIVDLYMEELWDAGNFGRGRDEIASKIAYFRGYGNPFARLQLGGLSNWKYAADHKWVRPFAWIYQCGHIARMLADRYLRRGATTAVRSDKASDTTATRGAAAVLTARGEINTLYKRQTELFRALEIDY